VSIEEAREVASEGLDGLLSWTSPQWTY